MGNRSSLSVTFQSTPPRREVTDGNTESVRNS
ncbi:hypothetical protein PG2006B_1500 [Bifidobacterium animalis subsp. animalis]|nr:hypothetical protein PG2006B_1500 [Bifidobacterium animalis subsp. animalis]